MSVSLLPTVPTPTPALAISVERVLQIERETVAALPLIDSVDVLEEGRAALRALESYVRDKQLKRPLQGAQRRTEARIGELLGEPQWGRGIEISHDQSQVAAIDRHDFRILAHAYRGDAPLAEDEWRKARSTVVATVRERMGMRPETPLLPSGQFSCIVADPPWRLDTGSDMFAGDGDDGHQALAYTQMSVEDITALEVESRAADDAHLYLWTTNRYLERAYGVARAWGFKPSVLLVWCKQPRGVGLGDTFRLTTEFVLFCRRGNLAHARIVPTTWFDWPRGQHSVKPDAFYELIESVSPGPHLEMFARRERPGWIAWGAEAP